MPYLPRTLKLAGTIALLSLSVAAVPAFADGPGDGQDNNCIKHGKNCDTVNPSATPELDSLLLFGVGLVGAGGYALTRFRARRRQDEPADIGSA